MANGTDVIIKENKKKKEDYQEITSFFFNEH